MEKSTLSIVTKDGHKLSFEGDSNTLIICMIMLFALALVWLLKNNNKTA